MPTIITRKTTDGFQEHDKPCNFDDLSQNLFEEQQITIEELKKRCARYKELLTSLQPPQDNNMIRAANFTTESVLKMLQQSPSSAFIRVYYGIEESGEHVLFMAPVNEAGAIVTKNNLISLVSEDDTIYVDSCCECPPIRNCPNDDLLEENPLS